MNAFVAGVLIIQILGVTGKEKITVDLDKIMMIESSGNKMAFNTSSHGRGLFQITPIVVEEWNTAHPKDIHVLNDLHFPKVSLKIAKWYMGERIPELLKAYKKPVNLKNILICWNAGIATLTKSRRIPKETQRYIEKYEGKANK